jgi:DNA-binding NarL/FixJ family response regulator
MLLTNKEKKDLAIKLIKQGCTQRDIAKQTHLSFKTISKIRTQLESCIDEKNKKQLTILSQAFMLFEENKSLVQIAI